MINEVNKRYTAKRHLLRRASHGTMSRFVWPVVCCALVAILLGVWLRSQTLVNENASLRQQLQAAMITDHDDTCRVTGSWQPGASVTRTVLIDGISREYIIHVPTNFIASKYYPLLLFYSGRGATAQKVKAAYGLDKLPAIVVYPGPTMGQQNLTAWQGAPYASGADDIGFTTTILDTLQSQLCIDRAHVYASGMSNGGGFTALLSCQLADRFAAYAIVAAAVYPPESDCRPPRPTPLLSIHGDHDPTVPYNGSLTRHLPAIESWTTARAKMNGCTSSTTTYPGASLVQTTWKGCRDNATVENVRVAGGGHAWGVVPNGTLWSFLTQFSL